MTATIATARPLSSITVSGVRALLLIFKARAVVVLVALLIYFSWLAPAFLTANNFQILTKHVAIAAILAIGMTFVVLTGGIDLSVGSVAGLAGMLMGYLLTQGIELGGSRHFLPVAACVLIAIAISLTVGILNGWLVSKAGVAPFIATLGTLYVARGAALLISNGKTFPNLAGELARGNTGFPALGQTFFFGLPTPVWIMLVLFAVAVFIARKTPLGRHIYAVGGNERAARLAGIRVPWVKLFTYVFAAVCAALVGLIIASQLEAAHPATGDSFELNAIAAVVLGGTSLMGGRGSITGSLLGACVIGVLSDGLVMLGVSQFWQMVIKGAVIILAVAIDQLQTNIQARFLPLLLRANEGAVE
ncbi:MAG: ABC transporter permease [Acidobacteria bacterium]|nr:ABC transporter permease [Acidobacteriota bacterium]